MTTDLSIKTTPAPDASMVAEAEPNTLSVSSLVRAVLIALLSAAALLVAILTLVNRPDWWRGLLAAGIVSALAAAASLPPLLWSWKRDMAKRVAGYFTASGIRVIVSLGGCLLAIKAGGYPAAPTLLLMVVFYFAILAAETTCMAKVLWDSKH